MRKVLAGIVAVFTGIVGAGAAALIYWLFLGFLSWACSISAVICVFWGGAPVLIDLVGFLVFPAGVGFYAATLGWALVANDHKNTKEDGR